LEVDISEFDLGVGNIPRARKYTLNTVDEIIAYVSSKNPSEHEGVVVCDNSFRRVKIKNPSYVIAHKLKSTIGASPRNMLEAILLGSDDDIIALLPKELVDDLNALKAKLQKLIANYDKLYNEIVEGLEDNTKKGFALTIQKKDVWTAPLYQMYSKRVANMRDFIDQSKIDGNWSHSFLDKLLEELEGIK
jgi:hypothetical protein